MYTVRVNDVPSIYPVGYFPRKYRYKKEAVNAAETVVAMGARMARVECPGGGELDFRPAAILFRTGQRVTFTSGSFNGKTGVVQSTLPSGRVLVKLNGSGPDANGRRSKLGSTMADPKELK
jgi:transcription antitermination factor NusG